MQGAVVGVRTDFAVRGSSALECQALSQDLPLYQPFVRDCLACLQVRRTRQGAKKAARCGLVAPPLA